MSNRARVLVKVRVPDLLEIPVSHVICESLDDYGHGQSWTCAVYILHADLLGAMGGAEDPIPPDGVMHPMPFAPFGGIWHDADFHNDQNPNAAPAAHHAPEENQDVVPMVQTPPQSPEQVQDMPFQPAMEATDTFLALHDMMSKIMASDPAILEQLSGSSVIPDVR